jgi:hypothetical protein
MAPVHHQETGPELPAPEQANVDDRIVVDDFPYDERDQAQSGGDGECHNHARPEPVVALTFIEHELERSQSDRNEDEADIVDAKSVPQEFSALLFDA